MEDSETLERATASLQPVASTSALRPEVRPDSKTQRYDRQLRLWGSSGQSGLESASILVINGSATATQILKNLVLPGIGSFTILDPCMATSADLANNFFLEDASLGRPRAAEAVRLLLELNESVQGHALVEDIPSFLARQPSALAAFTLVISVDAPPDQTSALAERCWDENVPLIVARSCGFIVSFAVQAAEIAHIETHPPSTVDLRLDRPFPSLLAYVRSLNFDALDSHEYGHIPSVVIVLHALEQWRASHDGATPATFKERKELTARISAMKHQPDDENFDEAVSLVTTLARPTVIPPEIEALFDDPACEAATKPTSPPFWLLVRALRTFSLAQDPPVLPLPGSLPDMKATSAGFHTLQSIYRSKAREDLAAVRSELSQMGLPPDHIVHQEVETFVKHAAHLHLARGTPYADIGLSTPSPTPAFGDGEDAELFGLFVALLATESFAREVGRWPGTLGAADDPEATDDLPAMERHALRTLERMHVPQKQVPEPVRNGLHEIARSAGADLPQMAALNGGMVAQEAIKLVTRQYIPVSGTVVFDGVKSRSATFA